MFLDPHKEAPKSARPVGARFAPFLLLAALLVVPVQAQERTIGEPFGTRLQLALAGMGGRGLQVGVLSAHTVYTREMQVLTDLEPLLRDVDRQARVVLLPGVSLRLFGFERLVGGAGYRGFDIDAGFRAGPGLTFSGNETEADRNRRFELVLEPFLRITAAQTARLAWLVELGSTRPALRVGVWLAW
ncbi:MAG: hypothetical protein O2899_06435 [Bacteroidetes bacterium]|nr:hypothetical protein [Bacteroidota bacterium]